MLHYAINETTGCWEWSHSIGTHGYGTMSRGRLAHRVSYETYKGPIPPGQHVLHECDNRACVNPAHLFLGSQKDNMLDASRKGRLSPISRGNLRGRSSGYKSENRSLTDEQVKELRELVRLGYSQTEAAKRVGCSQSIASGIIRGRIYAA